MAWNDFALPVEKADFTVGFAVAILTIAGIIYGYWKSKWEVNFRATTKYLGQTCQDGGEMGYFLPNLPGFWRHHLFPFFMSMIPAPRTPTLSDIIRAGDDGIFTSGMIDNIVFEPPLNVSWKPIYEAVFREYAWELDHRWDRSKIPPKLRRFSGSKDQNVERYIRLAQYDVWKAKRAARGARLWENSWVHLVTGRQRLARLQYWIHDTGRWIRSLFPFLKDPDIHILIRLQLHDRHLTEIDPHLLYYPWELIEEQANGEEKSPRLSRTKVKDSEWGETDEQDEKWSRHRIVDPILVSSVRDLPEIESGDDLPGSPAGRHADLQRIWIHEGSPAVEVSEEALAALCFFLGIELQGGKGEYLPRGRGGFGTCLTSSMYKGISVLRMVYGTRSRWGKTMGGSGYSTLFARHLACGCLPFARRRVDDCIETLCISPNVSELIKTGKPISDVTGPLETWDWREPRLRMLEHMPSSGNINYYSQALQDDTKDTRNQGQCATSVTVALSNRPTSAPNSLLLVAGKTCTHRDEDTADAIDVPEPGTIFAVHVRNKKRTYVGTWWEAVAGIAFGGLAPMATQPLINLVSFTVGETAKEAEGQDSFGPEDLMRMVSETIAAKIGERQICLFGEPLARRMEQIKSGRSVDYGSRAMGVSRDSMSDIVQDLALYSTLLESLIAMVPGPDPNGLNPFEIGKWKRDVVFDACTREIKAVYLAAMDNERQQRPHTERVGIASLLARSHVMGSLNDGKISAEQCGTVARCIIMAWTHIVQIVDWQWPGSKADNKGEEEARRQLVIDPNLFLVVPGIAETKETERHAMQWNSSDESGSGTDEGDHRGRNEVRRDPYHPMALDDLPDVAAWE